MSQRLFIVVLAVFLAIQCVFTALTQLSLMRIANVYAGSDRAGVTSTSEGQTVTNNFAKSAADEILDRDPPTLTSGELAEIEGVSPRKILYDIQTGEDGISVYIDRHGREWFAEKTGKEWRIENPFRGSSE